MRSRRSFLAESLAVISVGLGVPGVFGRAAAASAADNSLARGRTLIVVQLAGGMDGLNVVVPYTDGAYYSLRPSLRISESDAIPVSDRAAFHPAAGGLKTLFDQSKLTVVEGVGYPDPNFSHFRAMDIWQTADPTGATYDGWLGRYFEGTHDASGHPLAGLSVGSSLPMSLLNGGASVPAVESLNTFKLQPAPGTDDASREASLLRLYDVFRPTDTPYAALLDDTLDSATESAALLAAAHSSYKPAATYPQSSLASALRLLAELIDSGGPDGNPLRVGHVQLDGFDTHSGQPVRLQNLITELSDALLAFWQDIEGHGHGDDVLVMTWSEFGRRPEQNAQNGTDHGSVVPLFLVGNSVRGGFQGEPPSLTRLDDGNLVFTTDFRSVYATVIEDWLGASASDVLPGRFAKLPLLKT